MFQRGNPWIRPTPPPLVSTPRISRRKLLHTACGSAKAFTPRVLPLDPHAPEETTPWWVDIPGTEPTRTAFSLVPIEAQLPSPKDWQFPPFPIWTCTGTPLCAVNSG